MKSPAKRILAAVVAAGGVSVGVGAAPEAPRDGEVRVRRVALFKNGMAFVSSTATLPDSARSVRLGPLPVPSFGTFWVGYAEQVKMKSVVASMEQTTETVPVGNLEQLLRANEGRRVTLWVARPNTEERMTGILLGVPSAGEPARPNPYFMSRGPAEGRELGRSPAPPPTVLLRTSRGTVAIRTSAVTGAEFEDEGLSHSIAVERSHPAVRLELERPAPGATVSLSCLARGLTWAPSYRIDLSDPETARFSARALVVNELTDLEGVEVELVTGFPNIRFGAVASPLALSESLADFLAALARGRSGPGDDGSVLTQQARVSVNRPRYPEPFPSSPPGFATAAEGTVSEDLFLYPVEDFSLARGETAWVPLFSADMPYEHIYTWDVPDVLDESAPRPRGDSDSEPEEEVWHSCRLLNTLEMPLTTAAAQFTTDGRFTGQDVCDYTAPGSRTTIRINRAMNVLARQAEVELERTHNAARFYGSSYDLVRLRGELTVQSRLEEPVTLEVTKRLSGEVLLSEPVAQDVKTARGLKQVNPRHRLTWSVDLAPGPERTLVYEYEVFVRG